MELGAPVFAHIHDHGLRRGGHAVVFAVIAFGGGPGAFLQVLAAGHGLAVHCFEHAHLHKLACGAAVVDDEVGQIAADSSTRNALLKVGPGVEIFHLDPRFGGKGLGDGLVGFAPLGRRAGPHLDALLGARRPAGQHHRQRQYSARQAARHRWGKAIRGVHTNSRLAGLGMDK